MMKSFNSDQLSAASMRWLLKISMFEFTGNYKLEFVFYHGFIHTVLHVVRTELETKRSFSYAIRLKYLCSKK